MFTYTPSQFKVIVEFMLSEAHKLGASDAAVEVSEGQGLSVTVRKGALETIDQSLDKKIGLSVYLGQRRGNASTSDFSPAAVAQTVKRMRARYRALLEQEIGDTVDGPEAMAEERDHLIRVLSGG
jgi:predicted Zn-dependent protease